MSSQAVTAHPFLVPITSLRHQPGARRVERRQAPLRGDGPGGTLAVSGSAVPAGEDVVVDVVLEVADGGIVVAGEVQAPWVGECRRCLRPLRRTLVAPVRELYAPRGADQDEETYPLGTDTLDLGPLARDAVLLSLPLAPLCRPDCPGLCPECGADLNEGACSCPAPPADPRWSVLDALRDPPPAPGRAAPGPRSRGRD